jgi:hypothetical protein
MRQERKGGRRKILNSDETVGGRESGERTPEL